MAYNYDALLQNAREAAEQRLNKTVDAENTFEDGRNSFVVAAPTAIRGRRQRRLGRFLDVKDSGSISERGADISPAAATAPTDAAIPGMTRSVDW